MVEMAALYENRGGRDHQAKQLKLPAKMESNWERWPYMSRTRPIKHAKSSVRLFTLKKLLIE